MERFTALCLKYAIFRGAGFHRFIYNLYIYIYIHRCICICTFLCSYLQTVVYVCTIYICVCVYRYETKQALVCDPCRCIATAILCPCLRLLLLRWPKWAIAPCRAPVLQKRVSIRTHVNLEEGISCGLLSSEMLPKNLSHLTIMGNYASHPQAGAKNPQSSLRWTLF